MKINYSKTKEMLLGQLSKLIIPPLVSNYNSIERMCGFKLLGVYSNDPSWNLHVEYICALLTDLLFGIPLLSSHQFSNTAQMFGTTAWEISDRGELFALSIQWQRLCHTAWCCSMLSFRLFQIGATNFAVIFFLKLLNSSNCIHHLLPPLVTLKSHLSLEA